VIVFENPNFCPKPKNSANNFLQKSFLTKFRYKSQQYSDADVQEQLIAKNIIKKKKATVGTKSIDIIWSPKIRRAFIAHLVFRITFEIIFIFCLYVLQTYQTKKYGVSEKSSEKNVD